MNTVFRLRPINDKTIEEFKESYIWFSRPMYYKDVDDANVVSFLELNEGINNAFSRIFKDVPEIANDVVKNGICCFTKTLPKLRHWKKFPSGKKSIIVEYDRKIIEDHFLNVYGIGDCFKDVEYLDNSLIFKTSSGYDILWSEDDNGLFYKSIKDFERDSKQMDLLFLRMFTRINSRFRIQKESRIIIGGKNVQCFNPDLKGYKIKIPIESIVRIYIQPLTPTCFVEKLKSVLPDGIPIEIKKPLCLSTPPKQ
ncbi:MAG: hypothetical protein VB110_08955 [Bacteroidales bacterium]|nr:hypothetical protein [Bacteroidales bacterium]